MKGARPSTEQERSNMQDDPNDERTFAQATLSTLDPIEPSASLLRRVATIPLTHPRPAVTEPTWWPFRGWRVPTLIASALVAGLLAGGSAWTDLDEDTAYAGSEAASAAGELEDALSLALGTDWSIETMLSEEAL